MRTRSKGFNFALIIIGALFLVMCCCSVICMVSAGFANSIFEFLDMEPPFPTQVSQSVPGGEPGEELTPLKTKTPQANEEESNLSDGGQPLNQGGADEAPVQEPAPLADPESIAQAYETMEMLETALVPLADVEDIAFRLLGIDNIPDVIQTPPKNYKIGDRETFWLTNLDSNKSFQQETELAYITEHAYFWIEPGINYSERDLKKLADTFESDIYPTNREFFGSEWSPGIDQDEHLYIVYATDLGYSIAGYFSSIDSVHPLADEYSNGHETFMLNADAIGFNESFTYGVLAHEFQHMIHWFQDRNETSWLNEGFSELAALLNGYYDSGFDQLYLWDTDLQLNDWPNDGDTTPHYGAAFLFVTYFMDRFGSEATQALVADPQNGMPSVDNVLEMFDATDSTTGEKILANDVFRDWSVTNLLDDQSVEDGRYGYSSLNSFSKTYDYETVENCSTANLAGKVSQYGVDYYQLNCSGKVDLTFTGNQFVDLLPMDASSGEFSFWSNKGDHSDMTLTKQFDLTGLDSSENAELTFQLWYDIETDWDYVYVMTSTDGEYWEFVETPSGTNTDPVGNNYGWGYTGVSLGWFEETIDLSSFAGQKVWVRFEYITDAAVNGEGLLIDDISLSAIDYFTDFETDDGGWEAKGFVRTRNILPQTYLLTLIYFDNGDQVTVEEIELSEENRVSLELDFTDVDTVMVVISGTTRHTRTPAQYSIELN